MTRKRWGFDELHIRLYAIRVCLKPYAFSVWMSKRRSSTRDIAEIRILGHPFTFPAASTMCNSRRSRLTSEETSNESESSESYLWRTGTGFPAECTTGTGTGRIHHALRNHHRPHWPPPARRESFHQEPCHRAVHRHSDQRRR